MDCYKGVKYSKGKTTIINKLANKYVGVSSLLVVSAFNIRVHFFVCMNSRRIHIVDVVVVII